VVIDYDETHPPVARKVVCIDFDGTLFPWGELNATSEPLFDAVETVRAFKGAGYRIVIFTSRMSPTWWIAEGWPNDDYTYAKWFSSVAQRLDEWDIPFDDITCEKVPAEYYIDDKAIEFKNNWLEIRERVLR
jgi:hypothetical protein